MKQRFINMTEEERQESRKKGLEKIEQKKQAATSYKDDFSDLSFWKHLASTYNVRLPKYYIHCSERGVLTRFIKKVEQHLQEKGYDVKDTWDSFMKSLGYNITITTHDGTKKRTFKDYAIDNHPMYALCGLYLEYIHYDVLENCVTHNLSPKLQYNKLFEIGGEYDYSSSPITEEIMSKTKGIR